MSSEAVASREPLWLLIEKKIQSLDDGDLSPDKIENTVKNVASSLDGTGHNVSLEAGNMLQLRWAIDARVAVGRPLMNDFNKAISALKLEDVADTYAATVKVIGDVGETWPDIKKSERKADVQRIVTKTKLGLLISHAKTLDEDGGIRFLISENIPDRTIIDSLGVSDETFAKVNAAVEAERAERQRVMKLLKAEAEATDEEKIKHLITNDVAVELIVELAGVDLGTVEAAREAMKAEMEEKKRLAEEEAARKKAEAEGPPIEDIPDDQLLEYIESVREILEFSDKENEIRSMCEQSSIPKSVVDIAVSEPEKLDELEEKAGG
ncbi:MAG: hypothetical protein PVF33_00320 [Candidatus Latescibacterota bacterium]|jgi:hypothetical protein